MSSRWDDQGEIWTLIDDIEDLALAYRVGAVDLTQFDRLKLLLVTAQLAGEMSLGRIQPDVSGSQCCYHGAAPCT